MSHEHEPGAAAPAGGVPLSVPEIAGAEWDYVKECLDTGWVSSAGSFVERFEREFAARVGARFAVATASGTAALHLALLCAGVGRGDAVLVSDLTFIAPANAVAYCGALPIFIGPERAHWQMDPNHLEGFLERECDLAGDLPRHLASGRAIKAVLPVHTLGHPADLGAIAEIAGRQGLKLIEDASQGLGATCQGQGVGTWGEMAAFSFNGNKVITTGGGGMLVSDDETLARRARYLSTQAKDDPVAYVHHQVGYNYRLTNLQAALGCAQLERLDEFLGRKRAIARRYQEGLADIPGLGAQEEAGWAKSAWWLYTITVERKAFGIGINRLRERLALHGIQSRPLWQPLHRSPAHRGAPHFGCEAADDLHAVALSLPSSVGLTPADQDRVIDAIRQAKA